MRLQVFLSQSGIASRRGSKEVISSGRVFVNKKCIYDPAFNVDPEKDLVSLDNKRISQKQKIYIMLNKPKGVMSTKKDPFAKKTVMDLLPERFKHLNPVGRLDKDTTGLMLLTNDGELINILTHPSFKVEKLYEVRINKQVTPADKLKLEKGVRLDEKYTSPCKIVLKREKTLQITLHEGRKRQIRRMFSSVGYKVVELKRLKEDFLSLGALSVGKWRFLKDTEISRLKGNRSKKGE